MLLRRSTFASGVCSVMARELHNSTYPQIMGMSRCILYGLLLLTSASTNAANTSIFERLKSSSDFKVETNQYLDAPSISLEYCETNKCDAFASNNPDIGKFATFMDMYILYASGYSDLAKLEYGKLAPVIEYIQQRLESGDSEHAISPNCQSKSEAQEISCTLHLLANELSVVKLWITYDQGKHVGILDDSWKEKDLGVENIEIKLQRLKKLGLR